MAHTGTFKTRDKQHVTLMLFGTACVAVGALGGFVGAEPGIMQALIYGGFAFLGGTTGVNTFGKVRHDSNCKKFDMEKVKRG